MLRFVTILLYVTLLTGVSWYLNGGFFEGIDDANIYMVYMKHFAQGHGFVYNIGDERVEGFTSLLWTLLGAVFFYTNFHPEIGLLVLNIVLISYALYRIVNYLDQQESPQGSSGYSILFLGLLAVIPGYFDWTVLSLMETGLWSTLLLLACVHMLEFNPLKNQTRYQLITCLLIVGLVLCRPESMLWVPALLLMQIILYYRDNSSFKQTIKSISPAVLIFLLSLGALICWRLYYFGYPFPNTYYAKVSSNWVDNLGAGLYYLYLLLLQKPFLYLLIIGCIWVIWRYKSKILSWSSLLWIPAGFVLTTLLIPLYAGGDHFGHHRFIQPAIPLFLLLLVLALQRANYAPGFIKGSMLVMLALFSSSSNYRDCFFADQKTPIHYEWSLAMDGRRNSEKLNHFFDGLPVLPSQGVMTAGGAALVYKGRTIDLLGLNNTKMAHAHKEKRPDLPKNHASFNKDVFYEQLPDLFWLNGRWEKPESVPDRTYIWGFGAEVFLYIFVDEEFKQHYHYCAIEKAGYRECLLIFARKEFTRSLDSTVYRIRPLQYE